MLVFDHALILTPDVDATSRRLLERHGLAAVPGGRHERHGTANRIVPLGPDYLELMYVEDEDEARTSPLGRWALDGAARGPHVAALMLRVDDVDPYVERLGISILELERPGPDGAPLSWRLAGLDQATSHDPRPVFVECRMPMQHHPGRGQAPHRTEPRGMAWAEFGGQPSAIRGWVGDHDVDLRLTGGSPGPGRIAVATHEGDAVIDL